MNSKVRRPVTVAELAKRTGLSKRAMLNMLVRINAETGDMLLRRVGNRYEINTAALRVTHPHWFEEKVADKEDVEDLAQRTNDLEDTVKRLRQRLRVVEDWVATRTIG